MTLKDFKEYQEANIVEDIGIDRTNKFLFILESPGRKELGMRCPVAGEDGREAGNRMIKALIDKSDKKEKYNKLLGKAFGTYIKEHNDLKIGIMNVCRVPLQKVDVSKKLEFVDFDVLGKIRKCPLCKNIDDRLRIEVEEFILEDFKCRLKKFLEGNYDVQIIVCGKFAEKYIVNAINIHEIKFIEVCHPSVRRALWKETEENKQEMEILKQVSNYIFK